MSEGSYIRGAGATRVDPRRVGWALALFALAVLAGLSVWSVVTTSSDRSRADRLRLHGVPVQATVTGCKGISSGIGMGIEYYECDGVYSLGGASLRSVIHGNRSQLPPGRVVAALAVPGDPGSLALPGEARATSAGSWTGPVILVAATVVWAAGLWAFRLRGRRRPA